VSPPAVKLWLRAARLEMQGDVGDDCSGANREHGQDRGEEGDTEEGGGGGGVRECRARTTLPSYAISENLRVMLQALRDGHEAAESEDVAHHLACICQALPRPLSRDTRFS